MRLLLFDFDGTLTRRDTLLEFIRFTHGSRGLMLALFRHAPLLALMKLGLQSNEKVKQKVIRFLYKNCPKKEMKSQGKAFADQKIDQFLRPDAMAVFTAAKAKGDTVYVVSASLDVWIKPWCDRWGVGCISTQAEYIDGKATGYFATPNCYGPEKAVRIAKEIDLDSYTTIVAYGDSRGDQEMLALADEGHYRAFKS